MIGDGLAGTLLALALASRGARVLLIGAGPQQRPHPGTAERTEMATALSYGAVPRGPASRAWRRLERLHGPLGWLPSALVVHDHRPGLPRTLAALTQRVPLPLARVDSLTWLAARRRALGAAGVQHLRGRVDCIRRPPNEPWLLEGLFAAEGEATLQAEAVVLAAGAGCRALWPSLPSRLRHSWAGVLLVEAEDLLDNPWLAQARWGRIVQPRHWQRPALEKASAHGIHPAWTVDAGLAPRGQGAVVGQITWIPPCLTPLENGPILDSPDPLWMEERLREGLSQLHPDLAALAVPYRQVPVSYCTNGQPLVGPVSGARDLWVFAGFSAAFSCVPSQAEALADRLLAIGGFHSE